MCPYVVPVKMYVCLFLFTMYSPEIKLIKLLLCVSTSFYLQLLFTVT
jgi:hypothetical protein